VTLVPLVLAVVFGFIGYAALVESAAGWRAHLWAWKDPRRIAWAAVLFWNVFTGLVALGVCVAELRGIPVSLPLIGALLVSVAAGLWTIRRLVRRRLPDPAQAIPEPFARGDEPHEASRTKAQAARAEAEAEVTTPRSIPLRDVTSKRLAPLAAFFLFWTAFAGLLLGMAYSGRSNHPEKDARTMITVFWCFEGFGLLMLFGLVRRFSMLQMQPKPRVEISSARLRPLDAVRLRLRIPPWPEGPDWLKLDLIAEERVTRMAASGGSGSSKSDTKTRFKQTLLELRPVGSWPQGLDQTIELTLPDTFRARQTAQERVTERTLEDGTWTKTSRGAWQWLLHLYGPNYVHYFSLDVS
jgi:hypothetical protein